MGKGGKQAAGSGGKWLKVVRKLDHLIGCNIAIFLLEGTFMLPLQLNYDVL